MLFNLICCLLPLCSSAADTLETHALPEASVEVSAVSLRHEVSASTPQQALSVETATQLGITEVSQALKLMQGVMVRDYGGVGGMKTVSVRHMGATHTAVTLDGIPVSNCQEGQIDISRFPTSQLSQIRLGIGAPANLLAPASVEAASGVIALSSADSLQSSIKASYSSFNTCQGTLSLPHLWLDYRHTDGDYPFTLTNGKTIEHLRRNNSQYSSISSQISLGGLQVYYHHSDQNLPGSVILYNNVSREKLATDNFLVQHRYNRRLLSLDTPQQPTTTPHSTLDLQLLAKYNFAHDHYFDGTPQSAGGLVQHWFRYRQHEAYVSAGLLSHSTLDTRHSTLSVSLVTDLAANSLITDIEKVPKPLRITSNTVLRAKFQSRRLQLNGSLLFAAVRDDNASDFTRFCPSASASYKLCGVDESSRQRLYVRASARSAFRVPSFNDLYYQRIGNKTLRPETSQEYNLGLTASFLWRHTNLKLTADAFRNKIENKIVAIPGTFSWRMYNYGSQTMQGVEVAADMSANFCGYALQVSAGYGFADCNLPYTPEHSANGNLIVRTPWGTSVGYTMQYYSERYSRTLHEWRYRMPAFADQSLTLSHQFGKKLHAQFSCHNLFGTQYEIIQYYPMPGRQLQFSLKYLF